MASQPAHPEQWWSCRAQFERYDAQAVPLRIGAPPSGEERTLLESLGYGE